MPMRFSASSAARLMACPGSANLDLAIPGWTPPVVDPNKGQKAVGTTVHDILKQAAQLRVDCHGSLGKAAANLADMHHVKRKALLDDPDATLGLTAICEPEARLLQLMRDLPAGMIRFISDACVWMAEQRKSYGFMKMHLEQELTATWLESKPTTTPDVVFVGPNDVFVVDYKTGRIPVPAVDNQQLLFYGATVVDQLAPDAATVLFVILQPGQKAADPMQIDEWSISRDDLEEWMKEARRADRRILNLDTTLKPGDHCQFCPANPHSRGDKGSPLCPVMLDILYPPIIDEAEIYMV